MAYTTMTTSDALRKQKWEEKLYRDTVVNSYWATRFMGESTSDFVNKGAKWESAPENIVHVKTNLEAKGKTKSREGDKLTFGLIPRIDPLVYAGVTSGQTLKGKEIALGWYSFAIELQRYRQAVSQGQPLDWHRAAFPMAEEARSALKTWGTEKIDLMCFRSFEYDAVTGLGPTNIFYKTSDTGPAVSKTGTFATAKSGLQSGQSKITPAFVSFLKGWAQTGGGRQIVPIRPIMVDGRPYYVLLTHPDALFDWKNNAVVNQAHREALERGKENPIFRGADYIYDGVVIHTHEFITKGTDGGGSTIPWCYAHLIGAQALVWAWGERPSIVEEAEDYEEDNFAAWRMTAAVRTPVFNSHVYGSISALIERTNVSGT